MTVIGLAQVVALFPAAESPWGEMAESRARFRRLGRKAGIAKGVHAHGLRHAHAAELRAKGLDIGVISKQLGRSSISTAANGGDGGDDGTAGAAIAIRHR